MEFCDIKGENNGTPPSNILAEVAGTFVYFFESKSK
jgi:hypothetical protein